MNNPIFQANMNEKSLVYKIYFVDSKGMQEGLPNDQRFL